MIGLKTALQHMRFKDDRGRFVPFSLKFVACDSTRKEGGHFVDYKNVTLPKRERVEMESAERKPTPGPSKEGSYNSTVTFKTQNGEIKQCHVHLITRFNGEKVI